MADVICCDVCKREATWQGHGMKFCDYHKPIPPDPTIQKPPPPKEKKNERGQDRNRRRLGKTAQQ